MSDPLSDYAILGIRSGESGIDPMYPIPGEWADTVELFEADQEPLAPVKVKTMMVSVALNGGGTRKLLEIGDLKADLIVTEARVAVACSRYEKGGGWRGVNAGVVFALAANAGSKAMAAYRRRGKMLVGHVPYENLMAVGYMPAHSRRHLEQLRLISRYRHQNGRVRTLHFDLALAKGGTDGQFLAQQIAWWSADRRLSLEDDLLDDDGRERLTGLLKAEPLPPPEEKLKFSMYFLPNLTVGAGEEAEDLEGPETVAEAEAAEGEVEVTEAPPAPLESAPPEIAPSAADLAELGAAIEAVEGLEELPEGDLRNSPEVDRLQSIVESRLAAGGYRWGARESADAELVRGASESATGPGRSIFDLMTLFHRDHGIAGTRMDGFEIERVQWSGQVAEFPDLELQIQRVNGIYVPLPTAEDESWVIGLVSDLDLLVEAVPGQRPTEEAAARPLESFELYNLSRLHHEARKVHRLAFGTGSCVFTDLRVIGLIQNADDPPLPGKAERAAMPEAISDPDLELSSCVLFSIDRDQFETEDDLEGEGGTTDRWLQSRASNVVLLGEHMHLNLQPFRVIEAEANRKPRKGEILGAIRDYLGEGG